MERKGLVQSWSVLWRASLVLLLGSVAIGGNITFDSATAQTPQVKGAESAASEPMPLPDEHTPGTLYQDGPGEIPFELLPTASQTGVSAADEWVQLHDGNWVDQAYSSYTRSMVKQAKVQKAAYQSGTNGLDDVGVEP